MNQPDQPTPSPPPLSDVVMAQHRAFVAERNARFGDPALASALAALAAAGGRPDAIDVSRYQAKVDWVAVHAATAGTLAMWKQTQDLTWIDPWASTNRAGTAAAGFTHRLGYHWIDPTSSPAAQAAHLVASIGSLARGEGTFVDAEEPGITEEQTWRVVNEIEQRTQRPQGVYTGRYVDGGRIWYSDRLFADGIRPRLFAAYTTLDRAVALAAPEQFDVWQFTGSGRVAGVATLVDVNQVDNLSIFDAVCGLTPQEKNRTMWTVLELTDSTAVFIALADSAGNMPEVRWSGPGSSDGVQAQLRWLRAHGRTIRTNIAGLQLSALNGPRPHGDPKHIWTGAEFAYEIGPQ